MSTVSSTSHSSGSKRSAFGDYLLPEETGYFESPQYQSKKKPNVTFHLPTMKNKLGRSNSARPTAEVNDETSVTSIDVISARTGAVEVRPFNLHPNANPGGEINFSKKAQMTTISSPFGRSRSNTPRDRTGNRSMISNAFGANSVKMQPPVPPLMYNPEASREEDLYDTDDADARSRRGGYWYVVSSPKFGHT